MRGTDVIYRRVRRNAFNRIADLAGEKPWAPHVSVEYNGSRICGDMEISVSAGETKKFEEFIKLAATIVAEEGRM